MHLYFTIVYIILIDMWNKSYVADTATRIYVYLYFKFECYKLVNKYFLNVLELSLVY